MYLGGYENEEHAAEAYDVAALKTKGSKVSQSSRIHVCLAGGQGRWQPAAVLHV